MTDSDAEKPKNQKPNESSCAGRGPTGTKLRQQIIGQLAELPLTVDGNDLGRS